MSDTTTTRPEPHEFVAPEDGTRWCAREGCDEDASTYVHASEEERREFDLQREAERDARALGQDRDWHGYLTTANYEAVTERIRRLIAGKKYAFVASLSPALCGAGAYHHRPDVRTGMEADKITGEMLSAGHAHIMVSDSYGVWGVSSVHASQSDARADKPERRTYLHFKRGRYGDLLEIEHYAISGNHLWWVIAVEGHSW
jgi:hypothetical protein